MCVFGYGGEEGVEVCEAVFIVGFSGELWIRGLRALYTGCIHGFGKGVGLGLFLGV